MPKYLRKNEKFTDTRFSLLPFYRLGQVLRHVSNSQIVQAIGHMDLYSSSLLWMKN
jgi:hypothetical protein